MDLILGGSSRNWARGSTLSSLGQDNTPLIGKALANSIPASTTGNQARAMFGKLTQALANAYGTLENYSTIAPATGLDAGSVKAARRYLDGTKDMLAKYYKQMPEGVARLSDDQLKKLKTAVSTSSVAAKTVDDLFSTSWASELFTEIRAVFVHIVDKATPSLTTTIIVAAGLVGTSFLVLAIKKK